ncbi:UNVERIFIED_CONTAM: hypothetical protein Scaly_2811500 [Sesamum calycinum]|uniref:DUF4283 domain-containing protein n=1 Tax=Sesamum calycinum TaxID=2727403 RepID=A0AAW2ITL4_9LAMI
MAASLERLGATLSLTEEEEAGLVPAGLWHAESGSRGFYVVGRVLSSKPFHPEALQSTLRMAFNPGKGMDFKMIEGDRFLLQFFHSLDRERVLARSPWAYDKNLVILAPVDYEDNPNLVDFKFL